MKWVLIAISFFFALAWAVTALGKHAAREQKKRME